MGGNAWKLGREKGLDKEAQERRKRVKRRKKKSEKVSGETHNKAVFACVLASIPSAHGRDKERGSGGCS